MAKPAEELGRSEIRSFRVVDTNCHGSMHLLKLANGARQGRYETIPGTNRRDDRLNDHGDEPTNKKRYKSLVEDLIGRCGAVNGGWEETLAKICVVMTANNIPKATTAMETMEIIPALTYCVAICT